MTINVDNTIIRFTNDDYPHPLLLSLKKAGETISTPLDLDLVSSVEWSYKKSDGTVVTYACEKSSDTSSGIVYIPFDASGSDVSLPGQFTYDVQIVWAANGKKQTIVKSMFILDDDINKG